MMRSSHSLSCLLTLAFISCGRADVAPGGSVGDMGHEAAKPAAPRGLEAHERMLGRAREVANLARVVDLELPLTSVVHIEAMLSEDVSGRISSIRSVMSLSWQNTGQSPLSAIEFEVPLNLERASPLVVLERATVDGQEVPLDGTTSRWQIKTKLEVGAATQIQLYLQTTLPEVYLPVSELEAALKALPGLAKRLPVIPVLGRFSVTGSNEGEAVVAGLWPRLVKPPRGLVTVLEVALPSPLAKAGLGPWEFAGTGARVLKGSSGARPPTFVALEHPEVALVAKRAPSRHRDESEPWLEVWADVQTARAEGRAGAARERLEAEELVQPRVEQVKTAAVRARAIFDRRWGPRRDAFTIVGLDLLNGRGLVQMPGLLAVPSLHLDPTGRRPTGSENRLEELAGKLLDHHPAPREALDYAVGFGLAAQWLSGRTDSAGRWLEDGLGHLGGLATIEGAHGDKARRRAIEFNLRLPYQLARLDGEPEPILTRSTNSPSSKLPGLKSGLLFETLERRLGAEVFDEVMMTRSDEFSPATFRSVVSGRAPQKGEVDALLLRWLDQAVADDDVGSFRPEVLLEYLLVDGATEGLKGLAMDELVRGDLAPKVLGRLLEGGSIDATLTFELLKDVIGDKAGPSTSRWLEIGAQLFDDKRRESGVGELVEEVGKELGLEPENRARLETLGRMLFEAMQDEPLSAPVEAPPADVPGDQ
jgi:hypothetical protein